METMTFKELEKKEVTEREKALEFVKKVEELAFSMGVSFVVVANTGAIATNNNDVDYDVSAAFEAALDVYSRNHKKFIDGLTMQHLLDYIESCDRDAAGFNYPFQNCLDVAFHVYQSRRQVNINMKSSDDGNMWSVGNFIFHPENNYVNLVRVTDGVADYNNMLTVPINTSFDIINWDEIFPGHGSTIKETLRDVLLPIVH